MYWISRCRIIIDRQSIANVIGASPSVLNDACETSVTTHVIFIITLFSSTDDSIPTYSHHHSADGRFCASTIEPILNLAKIGTAVSTCKIAVITSLIECLNSIAAPAHAHGALGVESFKLASNTCGCISA